MTEVIFWTAWSLIALICTWKIYDAIRVPDRLLEWPTMVCAMWAYFYVYMAYQAHQYLGARVPEAVFAVGEVVPLLSLIALLVGWKWGTRGPYSERLATTRRYNPNRLWWVGVVLLAGGIFASYRSLAAVTQTLSSGEVYDWENVSAYEYLLYHIGYPGLAIALWASLKMRARYRIVLVGTLVAAAVLFIFPYILAGRRGPFFPLVTTFLFVPLFALRIKPRPSVVLGSLGMAGALMSLFLQVRLHEGDWGKMIANTDFNEAVVSRTEQEEDNEFVNSAFMISTLTRESLYQYGTGHLSLLLHWVPRRVYESKHALGDGWFHSTREAFDAVNADIGRTLLGGGAAAAVVADSYFQYGPLTPFFFTFIGWLVGSLYRRARAGTDARWDIMYVGALCGTHWFVSQGLAAAFTPELAYQGVPVLTFFLLSTMRETRKEVGSSADVGLMSDTVASASL